MLSSRSLRLAAFSLATLLTGMWVRTCYLPPSARVTPGTSSPQAPSHDLDVHRSRNPDE